MSRPKTEAEPATL